MENVFSTAIFLSFLFKFFFPKLNVGKNFYYGVYYTWVCIKEADEWKVFLVQQFSFLFSLVFLSKI